MTIDELRKYRLQLKFELCKIPHFNRDSSTSTTPSAQLNSKSADKYQTTTTTPAPTAPSTTHTSQYKHKDSSARKLEQSCKNDGEPPRLHKPQTAVAVTSVSLVTTMARGGQLKTPPTLRCAYQMQIR